jgi:hypothetical protein
MQMIKVRAARKTTSVRKGEFAMKRTLLAFVAVLLLASIAWAAAPKGKEVTITGKMTCTFCNLPAAGKCSVECCEKCLKSGDPVLLEDAKGNLYILLSGEHEVPLMTAERMKLMTERVTVKGLLVKRGGVQAIYVKEMAKEK